MLDPLDATPPTQFLDVAGGRIAYDLSGPPGARPIVCMHGMGDTRRSYPFLAPLLGNAGDPVAPKDGRGHRATSIRRPRRGATPAGPPSGGLRCGGPDPSAGWPRGAHRSLRNWADRRLGGR